MGVKVFLNEKTVNLKGSFTMIFVPSLKDLHAIP